MCAQDKQARTIDARKFQVRAISVRDGDAVSTSKENKKQDDIYILLAPLSKAQLSYKVEGVKVFEGIARPGMLRLIAPGEKWTTQVSGAFRLLRIEIPGPVWRSLLTRTLLPVSEATKLRIKPLLRPVFEVERLSKVLVSSPSLYIHHQELLSEGVTLSLIAFLLQNHRGGETVLSKGGLTKKQMVRAIDFAHAHIATGLSIEAWARSLNLEPHTFHRRFRKSTGTSPYKWFLEMRLEDAEHLLLERKLSIAEVARQVGYLNQTAFIDSFRHKHGVSPTAWRNRI